MALVDRWFKVFEEIGESPFIRLVKVNREDHSHEIIDLHHSEGDGFSSFVSYLKKLGWAGNHREMILRRKNPSRLATLATFFTYLPSRSNIQVPWKKFAQGKTTPSRFYNHHWSAETTRCLLANLKAKNVSFNDVLVGKIDQQVRELLLKSSEGVRTSWWIPVDMRPYRSSENLMGNQSSHLTLHLNSKDGPREVKVQKQSLFAKGYPRAAWWWLNILGCLPHKTLKQMLLMDRDNSRWCGTISNMGTWEREDLNGVLPEKFIWGGSPMPMQTHPLAFGSIVYSGVLSVSVSVHSCLDLSEQEEQQFFSRIISSFDDEV
jgi:NRPS condensation-like uncharacterized protein